MFVLESFEKVYIYIYTIYIRINISTNNAKKCVSLDPSFHRSKRKRNYVPPCRHNNFTSMGMYIVSPETVIGT